VTTPVEASLRRAASEVLAGRWQDALHAYGDAFRQAVQLQDHDAVLEVVFKLGHCYRQAGEHELAGEQFTLARHMAAAGGDARGEARALNGLALLAQVAGRLAEAEAGFRAALDLAHADESLAGSVLQNLGIVANIRGEHTAAAEWYRQGLERLERAGDQRSAASALNNLGMLHVDLQELDQAERYFQRAYDIARELGDVLMQGYVASNRVELYLAQGLPDRARESCDEAFEIFSRLEHRRGLAESFKFYGIIYRETGKLHLAEMHLMRAVEIVSDHDSLLEAEALRELSLVLRAQSRNREALEALNAAHTLFTGLQAQNDQDDITRRISQLETDFLSLVRFWGESIEAKDRYTSGHCERVADYACRLGTEAGIGEREMVWFRMGAFLHDLGKTEVAEEILNKPGRLTDEERAAMERHPIIGDEMLAPVEFPWDIRPMVRSHHERWDGRGYPDGLSGGAIPLSARILRIADVFDALTTARSYRRRLTPDEALQIMEEDEGSFDPEIFALFKRVFPELVGRATQAQAQADPARVV
jgi:HD-GYP domain-containing protein (c-di-GMP phosphodiesterase class II)